MNLPDADGFIVAAQKALETADIVYLHNAEGEQRPAVVAMHVVRRATPGPRGYEKMFSHSHIEPGEEVPWGQE